MAKMCPFSLKECSEDCALHFNHVCSFLLIAKIGLSMDYDCFKKNEQQG